MRLSSATVQRCTIPSGDDPCSRKMAGSLRTSGHSESLGRLAAGRADAAQTGQCRNRSNVRVDGAEDRLDIGTKLRDGSNTNDRNQTDEQAILDHCRAGLVLQETFEHEKRPLLG